MNRRDFLKDLAVVGVGAATVRPQFTNDQVGMIKMPEEQSTAFQLPDGSYVHLLLDETGSMESHKITVIRAVNEYIDGLRKLNRKIIFSLTCFNSSVTRDLYSATPIASVKDLTEADYHPDAMTPLYDAVGDVTERMALALQKSGARPTVLVIQTDGEENASERYNRTDVLETIQTKKHDGWEIIYLGIGEDAWEQSESFGVAGAQTYNCLCTTSGYLAAFEIAGDRTAEFLVDGAVDVAKAFAAHVAG